jgi:hypothetical protein
VVALIAHCKAHTFASLWASLEPGFSIEQAARQNIGENNAISNNQHPGISADGHASARIPTAVYVSGPSAVGRQHPPEMASSNDGFEIPVMSYGTNTRINVIWTAEIGDSRASTAQQSRPIKDVIIR